MALANQTEPGECFTAEEDGFGRERHSMDSSSVSEQRANIANVYSHCDRASALLCSCFSKLNDFLTVHIGQWDLAEPRTDYLN